VVFLNNRQRQKAHQYLHVLLSGAQKTENTGQSGQGVVHTNYDAEVII
jgi:hypothetical protein